ncbi:ubiquinol-cytochrome-c reductase complex assembly factor 1-like [Tigriopus californicus]|uniref:ubiquinol-cytochrome-c reductase complex assembly factor 1-like n=1 Tax=Tigriopus californicus TaxID=6832 RepID=UPI0027DA80B1|nr:ubiquinol-cytochrome-c reductase complex assembly factor 1-like [Tigriopus californicus]
MWSRRFLATALHVARVPPLATPRLLPHAHYSSPATPTVPDTPPNPTPTHVPKSHGPLNWVLNKFGLGAEQAQWRTTGTLLMTSCTQSVAVEEFFKELDMPDSFYSWFLVTELHIYMVSVRLLANEGPEGFQIRNAMIESWWMDCEHRIKQLGQIHRETKKSGIKTIFEEFQASIFIYDEGLLGDDKQLANAVWRRFFLGAEPDPEKIAILVDYIRRTMTVLDHIPQNHLHYSNGLKWLPLIPKEQ